MSYERNGVEFFCRRRGLDIGFHFGNKRGFGTGGGEEESEKWLRISGWKMGSEEESQAFSMLRIVLILTDSALSLTSLLLFPLSHYKPLKV